VAPASNDGVTFQAQDAAREVVDHRVQISSASIQQPDQRRVDVPNLVGMGSPNPDLRLGRMDALPGSSPLVIADQSIPRARSSKDLTKALSEESQCPGRDMSILVRRCQVMDRFSLGSRELLGANSWTRWPVIECTLILSFPMVVTRRRQPDNA